MFAILKFYLFHGFFAPASADTDSDSEQKAGDNKKKSKKASKKVFVAVDVRALCCAAACER